MKKYNYNMKKKVYGYVFISDEEEALLQNKSVATIQKYHKSLIDKGYLEIIKINGNRVKRFNLDKLNLWEE